MLSRLSSVFVMSGVIVLRLALPGCFAQDSSTGFGSLVVEGVDVTCAHCLAKQMPQFRSSASKSQFEGFGWPVRRSLNDRLVLVNYVDDEPTNLVKDYMGLPHSYNGHRGTDLTLTTFRAMDRGVAIVAAAPGTVVGTVFDRTDRNIMSPFPDSGNGVWIRHEGNLISYYWHPRTYSVAVEPGEEVQAGQFLAFVGSSGFSTDPHLHFEVQEDFGAVVVARDPWNGSFNEKPGLWVDQMDYVGLDNLRVFDIGYATSAGAGGNLDDVSARALRERIPQPAIFGKDENQLMVWFLLQAQENDQYRLRITRPDSSVFAELTHDVTQKTQYGFHYWYWNTDTIGDDQLGDWLARVYSDDMLVQSIVIPVGQTTEYGPRFSPLAGRSIRLNGESVRDTLRVSRLGAEVTFSLVDQPEFVTLTDSVVTIASPSTQAYRSLFFEAVAADNEGRTDTMYYHLVDPSKPLDPILVASESPFPQSHRASELTVYPNPTSGVVNLSFHLSRVEVVHVRIYDALGRTVVPSVSGYYQDGRQVVQVNTTRLAPGLYFAKIVTDTNTAVSKFVVVSR